MHNYLKSIDATVSVFYLSNVEGYLDGGVHGPKTRIFLSNVASLPLDETSTFIRGLNGSLGNIFSEVQAFQHQ